MMERTIRNESIPSNKPFLKLFFLILGCIGFAFSFALSGCYTERKGVKQSVKAYTLYPGTVAGLHVKWFPIKDSISERVVYKPGAVQWRYDTVTADCAGLIEAIKNQVGEPQKSRTIIRVPCPPCAISVDTLEHYKYRSEESTAALQAANSDIQKLQVDNTNKVAELASKQKALNIAIWSLIALGSYTLLRWILRAWLKINLP